MQLVSCNVPLPPALGAMWATLGELSEFRVAFNGIWDSVTLIYGDKKKRTRKKKPCAPGVVKEGTKLCFTHNHPPPPPPAQPGVSGGVEGGPKPATQPPAVGPFSKPHPDFAYKDWRIGCSTPIARHGPSTTHLAAPVELPMSVTP